MKKIIYISVLNIIAIISVVILHCNSAIWGNVHESYFKSSLIIECIFYFAVPLFCMITGATLLNYRQKYSTKEFFKKRIKKVLIPFLFWAIIMFVWKVSIKSINIDSYKNVIDYLNAFFASKEETTYYFMFEIMGIYLTLPLLSLVAKDENKKALWFTVILYFIFNAFLPNVLSIFNIKYNDSFSVRFSGYIIYVILGYLISTTEKIQKKYIILCIIGAIIGLLYRFFITYFFSINSGKLSKLVWGYTSWHCILLTCCIFIVIKELKIERIFNKMKKTENIINQIAGCSFGIYLIHQIVLYYEKSIFSVNTFTWQWRILGFIPTYLISLLIIILLKKIPIIKKIVP